jgi:D-alanyl-D-alanine carboxypeptidase (penicillin-binding protein 5/6)
LPPGGYATIWKYRRGVFCLLVKTLACALILCFAPAIALGAPLEAKVPIDIDCEAALLMEPDSGQVIFELNADEARAVASVTKVMTILLVCEALEDGRVALDDVVTVSPAAEGMGGSQVLLDIGEQQTVSTLLKCVIVASANDASVALAEHLYGSEQLFAQKMNDRARALGATNTHFVNCTGLPASGQYTTARDVALMSRELLRQEIYFKYSTVWLDELDHGDGRVTQLTNTNRLTRLYDGCDGLKTGSTQEAGYCISATAKRGDMRLVAVVLGAKSGKSRFDIASRMLDHGFANYRTYPVAQKGAKVRGELPVVAGEKAGVKLQLDDNLTLLIEKGEEGDITLTPKLPESVRAPVRMGQRVGSVDVVKDGRVVGQVSVAAAETVNAQNYWDVIRKVLESWRIKIT